MFKLFISTRASNSLKKLPKAHQKAIIAAFEDIEEDPFLGKPLERNLLGQFSLRVWVYRIVYRVNQKDNKILVLKVGHRGKVYI